MLREKVEQGNALGSGSGRCVGGGGLGGVGGSSFRRVFTVGLLMFYEFFAGQHMDLACVLHEIFHREWFSFYRVNKD